MYIDKLFEEDIDSTIKLIEIMNKDIEFAYFKDQNMELGIEHVILLFRRSNFL